jgi:hypothetical protein
MLDVLKLRCDKLPSSEEEPEEPGKKKPLIPINR